MTWFGEPPPRNILMNKYKYKKLSAEMIERIRSSEKVLLKDMPIKKKVQEVAVNNQVELTLSVVKEGDLWKFVIIQDNPSVEWASSKAIFATEGEARFSGTHLVQAIKTSRVKMVTYL